MLKYDPKLRYSAQDCLAHSWFKTNENKKNCVPLSKQTIDNISKIKIKTIVLENNKDYAIKMLVNELIYNTKKKDKKYNKYLEKIVTNNSQSQSQSQVPAPK